MIAHQPVLCVLGEEKWRLWATKLFTLCLSHTCADKDIWICPASPHKHWKSWTIAYMPITWQQCLPEPTDPLNICVFLVKKGGGGGVAKAVCQYPVQTSHHKQGVRAHVTNLSGCSWVLTGSTAACCSSAAVIQHSQWCQSQDPGWLCLKGCLSDTEVLFTLGPIQWYFFFRTALAPFMWWKLFCPYKLIKCYAPKG